MASRDADKLRADELIVAQGHADSRSKAKAMILAGDVRIGDRMVRRPAEMLPVGTELTVARPPRYVSRGGFKLEHALDTFEIDVTGKVAADLGASTGGFTDCLLQGGARRVYAVDVGYGQLDYRLREHERVVVMERTNVRYLQELPELTDLVTIDVSFISLEHVLPVAARLLKPQGELVALIKPQFEAGKAAVDRKGVVRDEKTREQVVIRIVDIARSESLELQGLVRSPLIGPAGNEEFLAHFLLHGQPAEVSVLLDRVFR
jgi:23S rRNA (cytidine1920-2'-O)/16S rRNA (cytidine1409-2'-O)-methyltransferase